MGSGKYVNEDAVVEDDCILNDVDDAADDPEIPKKTGRPLHDIPVGVHTADLDAFPKSTFAERSEEFAKSDGIGGFQCPPNFHQVTVYFCLAPGIGRWQRVTQFAASAALVLSQIILISAVGQGISLGSCSSNEDCSSIGSWCSPDLLQTCEMCGYASERDWLHLAGESPSRLARVCKPVVCPQNRSIWNDHEHTRCWDPSFPFIAGPSFSTPFGSGVGLSGEVGTAFTERDRKSMCDACTDEDTGEYLIAPDVIAEKLMRSSTGDWYVIAFVAVIMGWFISGEKRDILLCEIDRRKGGRHANG